jgi:hypothetical protein
MDPMGTVFTAGVFDFGFDLASKICFSDGFNRARWSCSAEHSYLNREMLELAPSTPLRRDL